ncbi:hypothetical protein KS4_06420 [Poriferisphaera corsica]|uniref:S1/P1 Nuclease n=1 Tax=Poriferisphaera corsica TaxID=2528020 RepID=A0A517YQV5_9BACT|nr:hypothetical protein [Poriferisphaera corsica]QDU32608.1 hypothetical protein KS4_06420 [Poriferisphaera corsica]
MNTTNKIQALPALSRNKSRKITGLITAIAISTISLAPNSATAWHDEGHYYAAMAATQNLPNTFPIFFKDGFKTIAHCSIDPDVMKSPNTKQLTDFESSEHYLDKELIGDNKLPNTRYEFYELCNELEISPQKVGTAPYAITEWTQRLTIAFAEYRKDPSNPHVKAKCLIYAGNLSHYAADIKMPLHTTKHFNGWIKQDGNIEHKGIHAKVDALPSKITFNEIFDVALDDIKPADNLFLYVLTELEESHSYVKQTYELADKFPEARDLDLYDKDVIAFTKNRERAASRFVANLFLTAWVNSEKEVIPSWLDRNNFDNSFDPNQLPDKK